MDVRSDIAVDSQYEAWAYLLHRPLPLPTTEDADGPISMAAFASQLARATPVYWSQTAYELAGATIASFDPDAPGSSFRQSDLIGGAEWWYLDVPQLSEARSGADALGPFSGTDDVTIRLGAFLLLSWPDAARPVFDLGLSIFGRLVGPGGRSPLVGLGFFWWRSDEPVAAGHVTLPTFLQGTADLRRAERNLAQCGIVANAFMHWRQSKLAVAEGVPPSRACRRRTERVLPDGAAPLIITLRAHESAPSLTAAERQYLHTWWVRGHERHLSDGRVVPVRTYLKGPDGAPLLAHESTRIEVIR
jgi:hypothetical protein